MKRRNTIKRARFLNRKVGGSQRAIFSRDFSAIEDNADAFRIIRNLAAHAGQNAAAEAKARGLARVYVRNNELIKLSSEGDAIVIAPKITRSTFFIKYKPSTILNAVR